MKRALGGVVGAAAVFLACGSHVDTPRGGLLLTVSNDGSLQLDTLKIEVASGDKVLFQNHFQIPQTPLPNTLSIVSNGSGTTAATITVSGWLGGVPVDRRDAIVTQIPSDREAALQIVLSARCTALVKVGADPQTAESTCPAGQTCNLEGGNAHCAAADVDASKLPDYGGGTGSGAVDEPGASPGNNGAACAESALQCNDLQPQKCMGGTWQDQGPSCAFGCAAGACTGECEPGTTKCGPDGVLTCDADSKWGIAVACPASTPACNGNGQCGVCTAGTKQCSDANGTQTCGANGQWGPSTACAAPSSYCNGAGECGVCHATDTKCVSNSSEQCDATGAWGTATACAHACAAGACTGVCTPGTTQCIGTTQQTCNAVGSWANDPVTAGICGAICTPPGTRCVGTVPQTCNAAGGWQSAAVTAGVCGAICTPGEPRCVGTLQSTCGADGSWGPSAVKVGACGAICTPTTHDCNGASYRTCQSTGQWDSGVVVAGQCGAVCTPNAKGCLNTDKGGTLCTGPAACWWVWTTEAIYDETCNSVGQWGSPNQCTGKCAGTNGQSYYNCDANHGGCIANGAACSPN